MAPAQSLATPAAPTAAAVPFVDLGTQTRAIEGDVSEAFDRIIRRGAFVAGEEVAEFEAAFAAYCGTAHCVGVGNGTDAIELGLRAAGVGRGHEVILPANTFVATVEAVVRAGAKPVLVDCDPATYLIDPTQVADRIGPRTRAIIPVHLYGQMAPMEAVTELAARRGITVLEDAAQAQGAIRHGIRAGAVGDLAATSFYPGKNLGAWGDAGGVVTDSHEIAAELRALRNHGGEARYEHRRMGLNSRLDTLQAVVLTAKLAHLDDWNDERRVAAARYAELLGDIEEVVLPAVLPEGSPVWHLYVVQVDRRDEVLADLQASGIAAGIHYPTPVHLLPAWTGCGEGPGSFPAAEGVASRILSLPIYSGITAEQQERVADAVRDAVGTR